jgi:hypothetical protein
MADPQRQSASSDGGLLLTTAVVGALAGAGGLAWWLWRQSRKRAALRGQPFLDHDHRSGGSASRSPLAEGAGSRDALPDRVQLLNQAIEDVRRQLESLQSPP